GVGGGPQRPAPPARRWRAPGAARARLAPLAVGDPRPGRRVRLPRGPCALRRLRHGARAAAGPRDHAAPLGVDRSSAPSPQQRDRLRAGRIMSVEHWIDADDAGAIEYASYWNDTEAERSKPWWVADGDFAKLDRYLDEETG